MSPMRIVPGILLLALGSACGVAVPEGESRSGQLGASPPTATAEAVVVNGLPYDGCSFPVRVGGTDYAPDASSQTKIAAFVQSVGENPARIEYQLTGGTAQVECGWGSHLVLPEIRILSIGDVSS